MLDKFRHKLPKDELKRFGKDISKKLVASDYKNNRVDDPSAELTEKQIHKIKHYVKDFMNKAVIKYNGHQERKAAHEEKQAAKVDPLGMQEKEGAPSTTPLGSPSMGDGGAVTDDLVLSDAENSGTPSSLDRKRKRADTAVDPPGIISSDGRNMKRIKDAGEEEANTPPPPPPPPMESGPGTVVSEEKQALREQEEALMRENEEAQRLEDEANDAKLIGNTADEMQGNIAAVKNATEVLSH